MTDWKECVTVGRGGGKDFGNAVGGWGRVGGKRLNAFDGGVGVGVLTGGGGVVGGGRESVGGLVREVGGFNDKHGFG